MGKISAICAVAFLILTFDAWSQSVFAQARPLQELQRQLDQQPPASVEGKAIWEERCASCHDQPVDRIPPRLHLRQFRSPEQVVFSLSKGSMTPQADGLSVAQIAHVATFLTGRAPSAVAEMDPNANLCKHAAPPMTVGDHDWTRWGVSLANTRFQPQPGFSAADIPRLKVKWVFGYPSTVVDGQPTVAGGRLFVATRSGDVFSLDAKTGCTYWSLEANGGIRTAIVLGALPSGGGTKVAAYFATENGFVQAVDAETGKPLWEARVEDHPVVRLSGSPAFYDGRIFIGTSSQEELATRDPDYVCCTSRGKVVALDAARGDVLWTTYTVDEPKPIGTSSNGTPQFGPAGATVWTTPTVDAKRGLVYVNTGNSFTQISTPEANAVVALDLETGAHRWVTQALADDNWCADKLELCPRTGPDDDMNASPVLVTMPDGKQVIVAAVKNGEALGLDPDDGGKLLWRRSVMSHGNGWGYAADGAQFYFNGREGVESLDPLTGKTNWRSKPIEPSCSWAATELTGAALLFKVPSCISAQMGGTAAVPGAVFSGSLDGHFRAYDSADGAALWEFDTGRTWEDTVNGIKASGGSLNYGVSAVAGRMVYVNSGAGGQYHPGNALIAFSVDGR